jgi:1-aminocyclopropane-1-carboxylate deaminase/D-cysteine desulfhydrase-like pyridoxal-dependent ACC family enzyme
MKDSAALATKIRAALAPCSLGAWPTPLHAAPALAAAVGARELWLKREDTAGGNKVRGLEFLLAGAPRGTVFVTVGGSGSTHCLATARHARALGHRSAVAQFPQPSTEAGRAVAAAIGESADLVVRAPLQVALPWAVWRAWSGARRLGSARRWIPGGGATPRAVIGHFLAALELASQLASPPDAIVVPLGTGGTAAGIALGMSWLGWPTRVVAARVAPVVVANRWRTLRLARKAASLIGLAAGGVDVEVVNALGRGYGHPSSAGEHARKLAATHDVRLDPTYGAKTFAALMESAAGTLRRVVFWHTFPWP